MATVAQPSLENAWEARRPFVAVFSTVDHKTIGKRYMLTAFLFFILGGVESAFIRSQLARPGNTLIGPETYNQLLTLHGTTLMFLFATPVFCGLGTYFIPLMLGARDMAFPRLNAFGYWAFLFSGLFLYSSLFFGLAPDSGWFAYAPLTSVPYSPGLNMDFWALGLIFVSFATMAAAVNFIVTIFKLRAPGMSLGRMPLFCWSMLVASWTTLFALPPLTAANGLLELERRLGFHFYQAQAGGSPLLSQQLFWSFGHTDLYIIFLPAAGIVSEIVAVFARRRVLGYAVLVASIVGTGAIAIAMWAQHMPVIGLSPLVPGFFSIPTLLIGAPAAFQVLAWIGTVLFGKPLVRTPLLFVGGFLFLSTLGGLTGVMLAAPSFDQQVTDSYFIVAHIHYVLVGGAVFPLFAAFYYWLPKMTGRLLNERLGVWNFWLMFIGTNVTFFPMYLNGLLGMPRRIYTYPPGLGWDLWNMLETAGGLILFVGILLFVINFVVSLSSGEPAGTNPWNASALEWATTSPPAAHNFETLPEVHSRYPLWDETVPSPGGKEGDGPLPYLMRDDPTDPSKHETLTTTLVDAIPDSIESMPGDTALPFLVALAMAALCVGLLLTWWWLAAAAALLSLLLVALWLWPAHVMTERTSR